MTIIACASSKWWIAGTMPGSRAFCRISAWYSKKERLSGSGQLSPTSRT